MMRLLFFDDLAMFLLFLILLQLSDPRTMTDAFETRANEAMEGEDFGYRSGTRNGPDHWGELRPDWVTCKTGNMQSPINLVKSNAVPAHSLGKVATNYHASAAKLRNMGHAIMLEWSLERPAGSVVIDGTAYCLLQLHWHSPSEHTVDRVRLPLEVHMVHKSSDNRTAVLSVLYQYGSVGSSDKLLKQLESGIRKIAKREEAESDVGDMDPNDVGVHDLMSYFRYNGSLTTPPCTEGVSWTVFDKVKNVSRTQVAMLKNAIKEDAFNNARPTEPTNGRQVQYFL